METTEKVHGCEGGNAEGWCGRRGCQGQDETDEVSWHLGC